MCSCAVASGLQTHTCKFQPSALFNCSAPAELSWADKILQEFCRHTVAVQQCSALTWAAKRVQREGGRPLQCAQYLLRCTVHRYAVPAQAHCTCSGALYTGTLYLLRCTVTERGRPCELTAPESRRSLISQPKYSERQPNISSVNINQGIHQAHYVPLSTFATLCPY